MAVRNDFTAGEVLAAADLNDTFASKLAYSYGTAEPTTTVDGFVWFDENTTPPTPKYWDGSAFQTFSAGPADFSDAATGTYTDTGISYKYITFTASGTLTVTRAGFADVLVVGGGGGGGAGIGGSTNAGGGGAGGYLSITDAYLPAGTHSVTVGAGGASDSRGNNSKLLDYQAGLGGQGGSVVGGTNTGLPGAGSGGGGAAGATGGAAGVGFLTGQGNNGGTGIASGDYGAGGGGGASAVGANGSATTGGGAGGAGTASSITGSAITRGGGGGGSSNDELGAGGSGGGGAAGNPNGNAGTANTGGGGGGGGASGVGTNPGGAGGSGVVIVRVKV